MNILKKISALLLLVVVLHSPLMAQKKLALANECFNSKAYYLASRYYQDFFGQMNDCHPDQLKMAQSLAATHQLSAAESVFHKYMDCQKDSPLAYLAYGKFLMDLQAYEKAIPYFEKAMEAEPQLARHYILACQTALPSPVEPEATSVFVNQVNEPSEASTSTLSKEPVASIHSMDKVPFVLSTNKPAREIDTTPPLQSDKTITSTTKDINLFDAMVLAEKEVAKTAVNVDPPIKNRTDISLDKPRIPQEKTVDPLVKKKSSPFGVRLGSYKDATIPDLSFISVYGTIEQKRWNGKTILFLVDFPDRAAAEAAVKIAREDNFRYATLVEKLSSGRMKSVK